MTKSLLALAPALLVSAAASAQTAGPPDAGQPATIPFVRFGEIYNFEADKVNDGIYLQDRRRNWYYATLQGVCPELPFAQAIAVKTTGVDQLDRFGAIIVDGDVCQIGTLVHSGPPPRKAKKPKA